MTMRFRNFGGIHQFVVADEEDLARIDDLDPARWAATSAPLADLHCDGAFLGYLDPEGTGRLRVSQLVTARSWLFERLAKRAHLRQRSDVLHLEDLDGGSEGATKIRAAAERVQEELKLAERGKLSLAEVRAFLAAYRTKLANGDGVVPPETVPEPEVAGLIKDVIATTGGAQDLSRSDGVGTVELDRFLERGRAWLDWHRRAAASQPWGAETAAAVALIDALDGKIEGYFWHCDLLRQEAQSAERLRLGDDEWKALRAKDEQAIQQYLAGSPLAPPTAEGRLALDQPANPVYRDQLEALKVQVLARALPGGRHLDRAAWRQVKAIFDGYRAWQKDRPGEPWDALGEAKVQGYLDGPLVPRLRHFIALDLAAAPDLEQVAHLEKLILYQRWLLELVNNFVNFSSIYHPDQTALIEMGSLVIDGKRLDFCLKVADRGSHRPLAAESLIYLVYAKILAKDGAAPAYEIIAPVTAGERGRLRPGKRGLFIDLESKEWDAVITEIVEQPISVKEAAVAPFRRAAQLISKKIEDLVAARQAAQEKGLLERADKGVDAAQKGVEQTAKQVAEARAAEEKAAGAPKGEGVNVNTLILGGSIALAGIGAALASLFGVLRSWQGWAAIAGVVLSVMAVSGLLGWLKLRRRDMSLLLEASGWAVNAHMKVNRRIGRVFTFTPALPKDSRIERVDVLATDEDKGGAGRFLFIVLLLAAVAAAAFLLYRRSRGQG